MPRHRATSIAFQVIRFAGLGFSDGVDPVAMLRDSLHPPLMPGSIISTVHHTRSALKYSPHRYPSSIQPTPIAGAKRSSKITTRKAFAPMARAASVSAPTSSRSFALSESIAMAAAVTGAHMTSKTENVSVFSKFGDFMSEQADAGKSMVSKLDLSASAMFLISAAMSYKEQKMVALVTQAVGSFIKLYLLLLFVRVLLTWFPNVDWMRQPWSILRQITDPYLNLFRNLIPPIMGQIDFTPILGFMVLQFLAKVLSSDPSVGRF